MTNLDHQLLPEDGLFEQLCRSETLRLGFKAVKKNRGSAGIDGVSIDDFAVKLTEELSQLSKELESWSYKPQPVRRVEIPKPGKNAGVRLLGIPCIRDRVVQASLKLLLEPRLDPSFSDHSYGFRPGRNQEQAVTAARALVASGKEWVVDLDLSQFFDRIGHERLMHRLSLQISDKRVLRLIGLTLRSGIMDKGVVVLTHEGSVQGSPLSPLLSNVVLDELDKELERRGVSFCRFADDIQGFVSSRKAAERVMASISKFIEGKLKLVVNKEKSQVAGSLQVKFLGLTIVGNTVAISRESMRRAFAKVRELIPRGTHLPKEKAVEKINQWYVGWSNYYKMTFYPLQLQQIEAHMRRRLRARFVSQHKRPRFLIAKLMQLGVTRKAALGSVYRNRGVWAKSASYGLHRAYSNSWFVDNLGLKVASDANLKHWLCRKMVVRLG